MKKITWFIFGFIACFLVMMVFSTIQSVMQPHGRISYHGSGIEVKSDGKNQTWTINQEGEALPYGVYKIKLKNGKTLSIHKNNRGNAEIEEEGNLVLVNSDQNVIGVELEK